MIDPKYKANIDIRNLDNYLSPKTIKEIHQGKTHRIYIDCMINGKRYDWMTYFNEKKEKLQDVIKRACEAMRRKEMDCPVCGRTIKELKLKPSQKTTYKCECGWISYRYQIDPKDHRIKKVSFG